MISPNSRNISWQSLNTRPSSEFPRQHLPPSLNLADWEALSPIAEELNNRDISSLEEFEKWIGDYSEFRDILKEEESRLYIAMTGDTSDPQKSRNYLHFVENLQPKLEAFQDRVYRRVLSFSSRWKLSGGQYGRWLTSVETSLSLFHPENIPLHVEIAKLSQDYQGLMGSLTIEWEGKVITINKAQTHLEAREPDTRERAWRKIAGKRMEILPKAEGLFNALFEKRSQVAHKLGLSDYRAYCFKKYERTDYDPAFCETFHATIESIAVPRYTEILKSRRERLGLETLRPWDLSCDPLGRPPLKPFDDTEKMVEGVDTLFSKIDPQLNGYFKQMRKRGLLDLENRVGKAPGGYQCSLDEIRYPFIFMNAVGSNSDIFTLLHEGGHSFHYFLARALPHGFEREAPMEFCEVASMSMELLGLKHLDVFYSSEEQSACKMMAYEEVFRLLIWVTVIDKFQHWLYTHTGHTAGQRQDYWNGLMRAFSCGTNWTGLESYLPAFWIRQPHLFEFPFYYIEYGIAQLGALQIWQRSLNDMRQTLADYKSALAQGGRLGLKELFRAAGIEFGMGEALIRPLLDKVYTEWRLEAERL